MIASSTLAPSNTIGLVIAALVGGLAGALILVFAYFIGVALVGAGLGALIANLGWHTFRSGDVPWQLAVGVAVVGAITAMVLQRYVIIVATAFGGAWTVIGGGLTLRDAAAIRGALANGDVWILYPTTAVPRWVSLVWLALGSIGAIVQLTVTGKRR